MSVNPIPLDPEQMNRIFPFHFVLGADMKIRSCGNSLQKMEASCTGELFTTVFELNRPGLVDPVDFEVLKSLVNRFLLLKGKKAGGVKLRGQLEWLSGSDELLFVGTPWFESIDEVRQRNLTLIDFAAHDQAVDLLHVLRNLEINAREMENMVAKLNMQAVQMEENSNQLRRLSLVASANEQGVVFTDHLGRITWANKGFEAMTGFGPDEYKGKSPVELCGGEKTSPEVILKMRKAFFSNEGFDLELVHYRKDGSHFLGRSIGQPILGAEGNLEQFFSIIEDVTDKRKKEDQIRVLSAIAENNVSGIVILDAQSQIVWVNRAFTELSGYSMEEVQGKRPSSFLYGEATDLKQQQEIFNSVSRMEPFTQELIAYRKEGKSMPVRLKGQPLKDRFGLFSGYFVMQEDITQELESRRKVKESEESLRRALDMVGDNVWEHDYRTGVTTFSKSIGDIVGSRINEYSSVAEAWWSSVHPDDRHLLVEQDRLLKSGVTDRIFLEYRIVRKQGGVVWIRDRGIVVESNEQGLPLKVVGTHTDITSIKETEIELKYRVKQFQFLTGNIPGVIFEYEFYPDGTDGFRYISPSIEKVFGISADQYVNSPEFWDAEDIGKVLAMNKECARSLTPFYMEARLNLPDRGKVWHSISSYYAYDSQEGGRVYIGFMQDITSRKQAEEKIRQNEDKYRSIIKNMKLGLMEVDAEEKVSFANQSFCDMSGYSLPELIGRKASTLFLKGESMELMEQKNEMREQGKTDAYEIMVYNKQGEKKWWLISGAPRYNDKNELVGSIGIHLDITEQKVMQEQLIDAREYAEESARVKEDFLANMSHEIRTPLNAILGMSSQLGKTHLGERQQFYLDTIQTAADNLLVIINDILDLSKIGAGKLQLESIGFNPQELVQRVIQVTAHKAEEKGLQLLKCVPSTGLSPVLIGDPFRINQVLLNLMTNAIKFTESGSVSISLELFEGKNGRQGVCFEVADTGIGMDKEFLTRLFEQYTQESHHITRKYGGTGLGMSIIRRLVDLMGGQITVQSEKGKGTAISIRLELAKGTQADLPAVTAESFDTSILDGKRILVADDNDMNRLVATTLLLQFGADVQEANNGKDAVAALQTGKYDLVLMDIQMPIMNGIEATQLIRSTISKDLPVIALTANALKGESEKCLAAGMSDFIPKPFKEDFFINVISKWLTRESKALSGLHVINTPNSTSIVDLSHLKELSRGNDNFVKRMVSIFLAQVPASMKEIERAALNGEMEQMRAVAHKIKPGIDTFRIRQASRLIRSLESWEENETNTTALRELIAETSSVIDAAVLYLEKY